MSLLSASQRQQLQANTAARARGESLDPFPVVKLYTPDAGAVWLLTEMDEDGDRAYGICDAGLGQPELGHVSIAALERMRGPRGLAVAADPHFKPRQPLTVYFAQALKDGSVRD